MEKNTLKVLLGKRFAIKDAYDCYLNTWHLNTGFSLLWMKQITNVSLRINMRPAGNTMPCMKWIIVARRFFSLSLLTYYYIGSFPFIKLYKISFCLNAKIPIMHVCISCWMVKFIRKNTHLKRNSMTLFCLCIYQFALISYSWNLCMTQISCEQRMIHLRHPEMFWWIECILKWWTSRLNWFLIPHQADQYA